MTEAQYSALAAGGPDAQFSKHYLRKDGRRVRMLERVSALRDGSGKLSSLLSLSFDAADTEGATASAADGANGETRNQGQR